jgi:hypothetical protein
MLELALVATLSFLLVAIVASFLLRDELKKSGKTGAASIAEAHLIAVGMPPTSSVKAIFIFPWKTIQGIESLGSLPNLYLFITRVAFGLAVLSVITGVVFELWA